MPRERRLIPTEWKCLLKKNNLQVSALNIDHMEFITVEHP